MSQEQKQEATLLVLRALAENIGTVAPTRYRFADDFAVLDCTEARRRLARMSKPLSCLSRVEGDVLSLECRKLEDEYRAPGIVEAWTRIQRKQQDVLLKEIVRNWGKLPADLYVRIAAGMENIQLSFTDYLEWTLEFHFPLAYVRQEPLTAEMVEHSSTLTMSYQRWTDPPIEGSFRFLPDSA